MAALGEDFNCHDPAPITEKKIPDSSFNCVQTIVLKLIYVWKMGHKDHQDSLESTNYRIDVIWTPLLNRTPPIKNSNTTLVKNLYLGQKLVK